ncbi:hypothetical protein SCA6_013804 [Theobroma cacao]
MVQKGFYRVLTDLNISATLPPEFSKFRHLKLLDLSRNYFTGSIPQEWATTKLEVLSFMGNRLSGPFPKVFTYITSLRNLILSSNAFNGELPPELAKLVNLTDIHNGLEFCGKKGGRIVGEAGSDGSGQGKAQRSQQLGLAYG